VSQQELNSKKKLNIPVLMYHEVVEDTKLNEKGRTSYASTCITLSRFENQMDYLSKNGYTTLSLKELLNIAAGNLKKGQYDPHKILAITFDDGYIGHFVNVYPILKKFKFTATIFVIASRIGKKNYLSWDQLKEMSEHGIQIESHGLTHKPLEILSELLIKEELEASKNILERNLNKPVNFISYPQGSYNNKVVKSAKKVGYSGSCTTKIGYVNSRSDPFKINRINIRSSYDLLDFEKILNRDKSFYSKLKFASLLKDTIRNIIGTKNYLKIYIKVFGIQEVIFSGRELL